MIRKFIFEDIEDIIKMKKLLFKEHERTDKYYTPSKGIDTLIKSSLNAILEKEDRALFVAYDGQTMGFIEGCIASRSAFFKESVIGSVSEIYIKKEFRGKGLSKELFSNLFKWFKKKKVKTIEVSSDVDNRVAIEAYEKKGFKKHLLTLKKSV